MNCWGFGVGSFSIILKLTQEGSRDSKEGLWGFVLLWGYKWLWFSLHVWILICWHASKTVIKTTFHTNTPLKLQHHTKKKNRMESLATWTTIRPSRLIAWSVTFSIDNDYVICVLRTDFCQSSLQLKAVKALNELSGIRWSFLTSLLLMCIDVSKISKNGKNVRANI